MSTHERARRLTIYVGETDQWHHRPLFVEIVHRAFAAGLAGATAIRGFEGYGGTNHIHTLRLLSLSEDLPVAVTIIDAPERIDAFLPTLDEVMTGGWPRSKTSTSSTTPARHRHTGSAGV